MHKRKFHGFWDLDTVNALLPPLPEEASKEERHAILQSAQDNVAHEMATQEPARWKMPAELDVNRYAQAWANEILPIAREAHERLAFKNVAPMAEENRVVAAGEVEEKAGSTPGDYRKWAVGIVREELHKAGWRLADLLEKSLAAEKSTSAVSANH